MYLIKKYHIGRIQIIHRIIILKTKEYKSLKKIFKMRKIMNFFWIKNVVSQHFLNNGIVCMLIQEHIFHESPACLFFLIWYVHSTKYECDLESPWSLDRLYLFFFS